MFVSFMKKMSEIKKRKMKDFLPAFLMGGLFVVVHGEAVEEPEAFAERIRNIQPAQL